MTAATATNGILILMLLSIVYAIKALPKVLDSAIGEYFACRLEEFKAAVNQSSLESRMRFEQEFICKRTAYEAIWKDLVTLQTLQSSLRQLSATDALSQTIRLNQPFVSPGVLDFLGKIEPMVNDDNGTSMAKFDQVMADIANAIHNDLFERRQ